MKNIWRGLSLAIFLAGVISFAQVRNNTPDSKVQDNEIGANDVEPGQSFVLDSVQTHVDANGIVTVTGKTTRYVKANGEWRLGPYGHKLNDWSANKESSFYAGTSDGVYAKGAASDSLRPVSPSADQQMVDYFRSHSSLRNNPRLVRTDQLLGLKVYVLRTEINDPANPQEWVEKSFSPKTGHTILRFIVHFRDGSEIRKGAVRIRFQEVPDDLNADLKGLPIEQKKQKRH